MKHPRFLDQDRQLRGVAQVVGHHRGEKLDRVIRLQPRRLIRNDRIGGGVRFVEAVAREFLEQVEHLVRLALGDVVLRATTLHEGLALLLHLFDLLLAHRAPQQISAAERVTAEHLRRLHDLLLINEHAVGLLGNRFEQRVRINNLHLAVPPRDEVGDEVHRPRTIERHERGDVLDRTDLKLPAQVAHASRFQLEHADGVALVEQVVRLRITERQAVNVDRDAMTALHHLDRVADDGQRLQPEEVHLQQAEITDRAHRVLRDDAAVVIKLERQIIDQRLRTDDDARRVDRAVARQVFEHEGGVHEFARGFLGVVGLLELG